MEFAMNIVTPPADRSALADLAVRWGSALLILGLIACICLFVMERLTSFEISMAMILGGIFQIGHAIAGYRRGWSGFAIAGSLLYLVAAVAMLLSPFALNGWAEWLLIISLSCSGLSRIRVAVGLRGGAGRWELLSGITTMLAAAVLGFGMPGLSLWPIAFIVALDLIVEGAALTNIGFAMFASRQDAAER
jgi:uncharacterized membrane protein HdeD (DUF308 family)